MIPLLRLFLRWKMFILRRCWVCGEGRIKDIGFEEEYVNIPRHTPLIVVGNDQEHPIILDIVQVVTLDQDNAIEPLNQVQKLFLKNKLHNLNN